MLKRRHRLPNDQRTMALAWPDNQTRNPIDDFRAEVNHLEARPDPRPDPLGGSSFPIPLFPRRKEICLLDQQGNAQVVDAPGVRLLAGLAVIACHWPSNKHDRRVARAALAAWLLRFLKDVAQAKVLAGVVALIADPVSIAKHFRAVESAPYPLALHTAPTLHQVFDFVVAERVDSFVGELRPSPAGISITSAVATQDALPEQQIPGAEIATGKAAGGRR